MKYKESITDRRNFKWFLKDNTRQTLKTLKLSYGTLRGLKKFTMNFEYPISVIAGENGSGKSTILAMVACGFHNLKNGFIPHGRKKSYYTFSDFFIQSKSEHPPDGLSISYEFLNNHWRGREPGSGWQRREKGIMGRWNNYDRRVNRNCVYFGVERIVPHYEKSVSKSYKTNFSKKEKMFDWYDDVRNIVSRVLNRDYTSFEWYFHRNYRIPVVELDSRKYSGFNMGAGENALFEIFSTAYEAGDGALLVIDEIELGLHEQAQIRFIKELKTLCLKKKMQIVCTTHSATILQTLPPKARFYLEEHTSTTVISKEISPAYATGKLSGKNSRELEIFVEDAIAVELIRTVLPKKLRERCNITYIGSSEAVIRQLSASYKNTEDKEYLIILDGDKSGESKKNINKFLNYLETPKDKEDDEAWASERIIYLPGKQNPEKWVIDEIKKSDIGSLAKNWKVDTDDLHDYLNEALSTETHSEYFSLANNLHLDEAQIITGCNYFVSENLPEKFKHIVLKVTELLK